MNTIEAAKNELSTLKQRVTALETFIHAYTGNGNGKRGGKRGKFVRGSCDMGREFISRTLALHSGLTSAEIRARNNTVVPNGTISALLSTMTRGGKLTRDKDGRYYLPLG